MWNQRFHNFWMIAFLWFIVSGTELIISMTHFLTALTDRQRSIWLPCCLKECWWIPGMSYIKWPILPKWEQLLNMQPVLILSLPEIDVWSQLFAATSLRCGRRQRKMHSVVKNVHRKAVSISFRGLEQMMQQDILHKRWKCREGWNTETRVLVVLETKRGQSFPKSQYVWGHVFCNYS